MSLDSPLLTTSTRVVSNQKDEEKEEKKEDIFKMRHCDQVTRPDIRSAEVYRSLRIRCASSPFGRTLVGDLRQSPPTPSA